jgi:hypothetical protein
MAMVLINNLFSIEVKHSKKCFSHSYVGLCSAQDENQSPAIPSKTTFLQKNPRENTGKKIVRNPVRNAILGSKNKFLKIGLTNLGVQPLF